LRKGEILIDSLKCFWAIVRYLEVSEQSHHKGIPKLYKVFVLSKRLPSLGKIKRNVGLSVSINGRPQLMALRLLKYKVA
jgi:hypothetical protein